MIKTLTPIKVSVQTTKKDGTPYKNNSARIGLLVKNNRGEDMWLNGFGQVSDAPENGDSVTVDIFQKEYDGKLEWSFKFLSPIKILQPQIDALKAQVEALTNNKLLANPTVKEVTLEELAENGVIENEPIPFQ